MTLSVALALLALTASSAMAAAPEAPETTAAESVKNTTATLRGVVNPKAPATVSWFFEYNTGSSCTGPGAATTPVHGPEEVQERGEEQHLAGLRPGTGYTACLVARNEAEEATSSNEVSFTTTAVKPTIEKQSVSSLTSTEAGLSAAIDAEGSPTSYSVQYGTSEAYGSESPHVGVGAPVGNVGALAYLGGLLPAIEYHFRFVASSPLGTTFGGDVAFTTPTAEGAPPTATCPNQRLLGFSPLLPDCRAYELVSSAGKEGETYTPSGPAARGFEVEDTQTERPFRAAATEPFLAFIGDPDSLGGAGSQGKGLGEQLLARRGPNAGPAGWEESNISPPAGEGEHGFNSGITVYEALSPDLSAGVFVTGEEPIRSPAEPQGPAGCPVLYSHSVADNRNHALFTTTTTPEFCGQVTFNVNKPTEAMLFAGSSKGGSQALFQTSAALIPQTTQTVGEGANLYDSLSGVLRLINVLPDGKGVEPNATFGGPPVQAQNPPGFSHVISPDGSRIIWSSVEALAGAGVAQPKALYARENPTMPQSPIVGGRCTVPTDACTVQLDVKQPGATGADGGGRFWTASADGTKVFFTDCNRLTSESTAVPSEGCEHLAPERGNTPEQPVLTGNDLYEYDFSKPMGERLTDLTIDHSSDPLGADVQGLVGSSEDGSYVYFVAGAKLTSEANSRGEVPATRRCEEGEKGAEREEERLGNPPAGKGCNLYVWHAGASVRFIGLLSAKDDRLTQVSVSNGKLYGAWVPDLGSRTGEVTADGAHLTFESMRHLTGYDTSALANVASGEHALEVFVYDAASNTLLCASCDPNGAPPDATIDGIELGGTGAGAHLPVSSANTFMRRWMSPDGNIVFFDSSQPLVARDTNRVQDVYEWEREGTGGCPPATPARLNGGCTFLLSGGESSDYSYLLDADENASNVFITHRGQLAGAGPPDDKTHVFDVRVDGGFSAPSLGCAGPGCQAAPPASPAFVPPPTGMLSGLGNYLPAPPPPPVKRVLETRAQKLARALRACRRHSVKRRRPACERLARARYGAKPKPHHHRRSKR
jgi:hypothetical protein